MGKKMTTKVILIAGRVMLGLAVAAIGAAVAILIVIPKAVHGTALTVLTGSMTPTIPVGSVVIERPVDPGTLHVGDIATYQVAPGKAVYITHRIVKIDTSKSPAVFTFKGDANRGADITPVPSDAIRGKVWFHVPYLGSIRDAISTRGGLAGLAILLLAGYSLWQFSGSFRNRLGRHGHESDVANSSHTPLDASSEADEQVIVATLPRANFDGLSADIVARLLGGAVLEANETTFTVVVTRPSRGVNELVSVLQPFEPLSIDMSGARPQAVSTNA